MWKVENKFGGEEWMEILMSSSLKESRVLLDQSLYANFSGYRKINSPTRHAAYDSWITRDVPQGDKSRCTRTACLGAVSREVILAC